MLPAFTSRSLSAEFAGGQILGAFAHSAMSRCRYQSLYAPRLVRGICVGARYWGLLRYAQKSRCRGRSQAPGLCAQSAHSPGGFAKQNPSAEGRTMTSQRPVIVRSFSLRAKLRAIRRGPWYWGGAFAHSAMSQCWYRDLYAPRLVRGICGGPGTGGFCATRKSPDAEAAAKRPDYVRKALIVRGVLQSKTPAQKAAQ